MKLKAISLLVALSFWGYPMPVQAQTEAILKFNKENQNKQVELAKESVIYKTDVPIQQINASSTEQSRKGIDGRNSNPRVKKQTSKKEQIRRDYPAPTADKQAVKVLIIKYSNEYGISPEAPLCIAYYESGYNASSKNKSSSASGVFQYLSGTWKGTDEGKAGESVFNAEANVKAAIKYMASRRSTQPWEVRNKCPKIQIAQQ